MPDVNKLTLAIAADKTPDIALGLASYVPFDLSSVVLYMIYHSLMISGQ